MVYTKRKVDSAMSQDRPEKSTIRNLWLEQAISYNKQYKDDKKHDVPLYLTLGGAEGKDIQLLIENGIIKLTEVGGIDTESQSRVVAIENSPPAVLKLQKKFSGLRIIEQSIQEIVRGDTPIRFPVGEDILLCRSRIINLDLNSTLEADDTQGNITFPIITWIVKLCELHNQTPILDWCLCLTLHGEILWPKKVCKFVQEFLQENLMNSKEFENSCSTLLGNSLIGKIKKGTICDFSKLSREQQQKILMIFVPKKITQHVVDKGWRVETSYNLRYGGYQRKAPMVSWIMQFINDNNAASTPVSVYKECLKNILSSAGLIEENGKICSNG